MPSPTAIPPYIVDAADPARVVLERPPHRMARLMRIALRFTGLALLALAALLVVAAGQLEGADRAIALGFGLLFVVGSGVTLWWMARSGGVRRVEIEPAQIRLHRAGFAGIERRVTLPRSTVEGLRAQALGEGRASSWRLWLRRAQGDVEVATIRRTADDLGPARQFAGLLGVALDESAG